MTIDAAPAVARPRRRVPRALIVVLIAVVVLAAIGVIAYSLGHRAKDPDTESEVRTAVVERTSLAAGFVLTGELGYGDVEDLGGATGIVTKVPVAGEEVATGEVIMEIEGAPVFLLQGDLPLWRDIGPGVVGLDVEMLRAALDELGYDAGAGQEYDEDLSLAIAELFEAAGYPEPVATAEDEAAQKAAQDAVDQAEAAVVAAEAAYAAAEAAEPSFSAQVAADNAVKAAERALEAAESGDCSGLPGSATGVCAPDAIESAEDALDLAIAQREDLFAPSDLTMYEQAIDNAEAALEAAQTAYERTLLNTVGPRSILMVPEDRIRIDSVEAKVGVAAQGAVVRWTQTTLYGHVRLTEAQRRLLATGTPAQLTLPDGTELMGVVEEITEQQQNQYTGERTPATARIDIDEQDAVEDLGPTSVTVTFIQEEAEDTLVVPVTALMVPVEGGYCVELPDETLIFVEVGLVADTRVQIFTDELEEGDLVVIP
jgi:hypothetical protein